MMKNISIMLFCCSVLCFFYSCDVPKTCEYVDIAGVATVTYVSGLDSNGRVEVKFDFVPDDATATYNYLFPDWPDTDQYLTVDGGENPTQEWVDEQEIEEGSKHTCVRSERTSGTCTPVVFSFDGKVEDEYEYYIENDEPIILDGNDLLEIIDTHYVQKNQITIQDNAQLIIRDSLFEHQMDYRMQHTMELTGNADVVVDDSIVYLNVGTNWNLYDNASLSYSNVEFDGVNVWHGVSGSAQITIDTMNIFGGTVSDNAYFDISGVSELEVEMVFPVGSIVDESFPVNIDSFSFPNEDDKNIDYSINITNSVSPSWGISVLPSSDITIRDSESVIITFVIGLPWEEETIELEDLLVTHYDNRTWTVLDSTLTLVNVSTLPWSPIVGRHNTLVIRNSELADNAFSWDHGTLIVESSSIDYLRAQEYVEMTITDCTVVGDVLAIDNGKITLINTTVGGEIIEEDNGKVTIQ